MVAQDEVCAYAPRRAARELFYARDHEVLLEGPAGTGKTRAVLEKVFLCAMKYAGMRALLARKTRASMSQSVLVTFQEKVLPPGHYLHDGPERQYRQNYRLRNGSEIVIGGLDNADRIMSTEYDMIAVFEATEATLEDWEKLTTRLRNGIMPYQQAIADCNPGPPSHWLNVRAKAANMRRLVSRHEDNPVYWNAATSDWTPLGARYLATLDRLGGVRHQRLRLGLWAAAEGLVYPTLPHHVLPMPADGTSLRLPSPAVRVAAGVDWGFNDPLAVVVGAIGQDGGLYIVDEIYESNISLESTCHRLAQIGRQWNIEVFYCDPARPDVIAMMRRSGVFCNPNQMRSIDVGIAMVDQRLRSPDFPMKIFANCTNLLREAGEYQYTPLRDGGFREAPSDRFNHAMDALRYLVCGLDRHRTLLSPQADADAEYAERSAQTLLRLGHQPESVAELAQREERQAAERRFRLAWGR